MGEIVLAVIGVLIVTILYKGIKIVPQQSAWVVERLGRYERTLQPGMSLLIPFIHRVAYRHSLKESAYDVQEQTAITRDNVTLVLDGVIYLRVIDPVQASYGVNDPLFAATQLAQTTMRSELGKLALDESFEERERLNANIVATINQAAQTWGVQCMRYEIRNITPPSSILKAMEMQVSAERRKRAEILESEGQRQSQINIAEAQKQQVVLSSEAAMTDQVNRARGQAEAIISVAEATAQGISTIAASITQHGGREAVSLQIAEQYIEAFEKLAKTNNTILLPANLSDAGSMVAQAMAVFDQISQSRQKAADAATPQSNSKPWG